MEPQAAESDPSAIPAGPAPRSFDPRYGEAVALSALVTRVTARNPSPFTFLGTASYVLGARSVVLIDPGPDLPEHRHALLAAIAGRPVEAILVTHRHRDHVEGIPALRRSLQAPVLAAAAEGASAVSLSAEGGYGAFAPDRLIGEGDMLAFRDVTLEAVATPGHASDHLVFAMSEESALFSGDHVMGWSTTVIAPPDGHMGRYLASLRRLLGRPERLYYPGHGEAVENGPSLVQALLEHRLAREAAIEARLQAGDRTVPEIVAALYTGLSPSLSAAAAHSVLAHLEHLVEQGRVSALPECGMTARYQPR